MIGAAPFLGGGLIAAGSGGGCPSPMTDSQDPASPSSICSFGPSPGSGGSGNCGGGGGYGGGPGGGGGGRTCAISGVGGNGNSLGRATIQAMMPLSAGNNGSAMCCDGSGGGPAGGGYVGTGASDPVIDSALSGGSGGFGQGTGWSNGGIWYPQCDGPPGGPSPAPVPSSGFSTSVHIRDQSAQEVSGLPVLCVETGVTQTSICGELTFFLPSGANFLFKTPGGSGKECGGTGGTFSYPPGSKIGTAESPVEIVLTHS